MRRRWVVVGRLAAVPMAILLIWSGLLTSLAEAKGSDLSRELKWLALGDSFSSGEGVKGASGKCARSDKAYAYVARDELGENVNWKKTVPTFEACTGAKIEDIPKQLYLAGDRKFDLVTLTIGGNNMSFSGVLIDCMKPIKTNRMFGAGLSRCRVGEAELKERANRVAKNLERIYTKLREEALLPGGKVVVLGYPRLWEPPSVWPTRSKVIGRCKLLHKDDAKMVREVGKFFNDRIKNTVKKFAPQMRFIDVEERGFKGHNLCTGKGGDGEWLNGLSLGFGADQKLPRPQQSVHPHEAGHAFEGRELAKELSELRWDPADDAPDEDGKRLTAGKYVLNISPMDSPRCTEEIKAALWTDHLCQPTGWKGKFTVDADGKISGAAESTWRAMVWCNDRPSSMEESESRQKVEISGDTTARETNLRMAMGKVKFERTLKGVCKDQIKYLEELKRRVMAEFYAGETISLKFPGGENSLGNHFSDTRKIRKGQYDVTISGER